jgi:hypothetical protein
MNLLYAVSAQGNPLYQGKFGLHGRYQTYGQHSFIYDLIAAAYRRGVRVTLLVEGLSGFPLAEPQWSPQNRPTVVRAKPANGKRPGTQ